MRLFGSDRIAGIMTRLGMQEGEPIEHRWLNHSIESAQRRVEQRNFSIRKRTLEYDDVMNRQRSVVYDFRSKVLANEDIHGLALDVLHDMVLTEAEERLSDPKSAQPEDYAEWASRIFPVGVTADDVKPFAGDPEGAAEMVFKQVEEAYEMKCSLEDPQVLPRLERFVVLRSIDREWQDYLRAMDDLRDAVRLRAYGQRDPLVEYKREAYGMFERLMASIKQRAASGLFRASTSVETMQNFMAQVRRPRRVQLAGPDPNANACAVVGCVSEIDKTIDHIKRFVRGVDRVATADTDMTVGSWLSTTRSHCKSCNLSTQGSVERGCRCLLKDVCLDSGHATRQLVALLSTVAYHDNLVQLVRVVDKCNLHRFLEIVDVNVQRTIAHELYSQSQRGFHFRLQGEVAIKICDNALTFF